jgi:predicted TIM-barrel fold metal-dependent hydrolase
MNRDAWRAQYTEAAVEPDLPIIDAHHHLWPEPPLPGYEPYTDETAIAEMAHGGHNIIATVAVEARGSYFTYGPETLRPVGETVHAEALAQLQPGFCAAIVAHADLLLGHAVDVVLSAHMVAAPMRLRGIRHVVAWDPDLKSGFGAQPGMLAHPDFRAGFGRLAPNGLSFDVWALHSQLGEVLDLARAFPETSIIIDHIGGPIGIGRYAARPSESFADWRAALAPLATCNNVTVKLGGLHISIIGFSRLDAAAPLPSSEMAAQHGGHIRAVIDLFGPERVMFESNFPVDRMSTPHDVLWNSFKLMTQGYTHAERAAMFAGTARRVYRIAPGEERI